MVIRDPSQAHRLERLRPGESGRLAGRARLLALGEPVWLEAVASRLREKGVDYDPAAAAFRRRAGRPERGGTAFTLKAAPALEAA